MLEIDNENVMLSMVIVVIEKKRLFQHDPE